MSKDVDPKWIRTEADKEAIKLGCYLDEEAGQRVIDFIETFVCYTRGDQDLIGKPVKLLDWQTDFLIRLFGWKKPNGKRRFRSASVWLPKKNGKTTLCAWIVLYLLIADGEHAAEVFSGANSSIQAKQIYTEIKDIVDNSPELHQLLKPVDTTKRITFEARRSYYEVLSTNPKSCEGKNASGCVIDEIHRFTGQRDEDFFNALRWSGKARRNPLFITISTAGVFDPTTIAWKEYRRAKDIIEGINKQTDCLAVIYEGEKEDEWTTKNPNCVDVWRKSNPSLGVTMDVDDFRNDVIAAENSPSNLSAFLRYSFNIWTSATSAWLTNDQITACRKSFNLTDEQIKKFRWYAGLDLAKSVDINALVLIGHDEENNKYYLKPFYWVSDEQASARQRNDQVNYEDWAKEGHIITHPGNVVDWLRQRKEIAEICKKYKVVSIGIDRWEAHPMVQLLQDEDGLPVGFVGQGFKDMTSPVREMERMFLNHELVFDCPVFAWMMGNIQIRDDSAGNVKIDKQRSKEKVDGPVAACMAIHRLMDRPKISGYDLRAKQRAEKEQANEEKTKPE